MELFLLPLMLIVIFLAFLWFHDTHDGRREVYATQKVASTPPPMR
jgi:hypothetical protein